MVAEILDRASLFKLASRVARELRCCSGKAVDGGDEESVVCAVGGRWETQSWTRRETFGFETRLCVLRDAGLVVMIMVGEEVNGVNGR